MPWEARTGEPILERGRFRVPVAIFGPSGLVEEKDMIFEPGTEAATVERAIAAELARVRDLSTAAVRLAGLTASLDTPLTLGEVQQLLTDTILDELVLPLADRPTVLATLNSMIARIDPEPTPQVKFLLLTLRDALAGA